jgi:hypothetical protein
MRAGFLGGHLDGREKRLDLSPRLRLYCEVGYEMDKYYRFTERDGVVYFAHLSELNFWKSVDDFSILIN